MCLVWCSSCSAHPWKLIRMYNVAPGTAEECPWSLQRKCKKHHSLCSAALLHHNTECIAAAYRRPRERQEVFCTCSLLSNVCWVVVTPAYCVDTAVMFWFWFLVLSVGLWPCTRSGSHTMNMCAFACCLRPLFPFVLAVWAGPPQLVCAAACVCMPCGE